MKDTPLARLFAALANADRLALVQALCELPAGGDDPSRASIAELARLTGLSRFSASRHLSILRDAGLVVAESFGQRILHEMNWRGLQAFEDWLYPLLDAADVSTSPEAVAREETREAPGLTKT